MTLTPLTTLTAGTCGPCATERPPAPPVTVDLEAAARLAEYAKALGHPARVAIVRFLLASETCFAGAIADALPLAASTVSQHLQKLKESGLIQGDIDGPRVCYCVNRAALGELKALIAAL